MNYKTKDFWSLVAKGSESSCWEWLGYRQPKGYGRATLNKRQQLAHRIAWQLANGELPDGMCVLHKCDNPPCCNPAHLFLGTTADNNADKLAKGRLRVGRGERHNKAKLSETQIKEIRDLAESGLSNVKIGKIYDISNAHISSIVRKKYWAHVVQQII